MIVVKGKKISNKSLFQVPWWKPQLREKMSEFPPIFKNAEINIEDVGEYMQDLIADRGGMKGPRRSLISSHFAEKMLVATPLLK
jgi:hypothetical protein